VRVLFEKGFTEKQINSTLGYDAEDIKEAIADYKKDETTDYDDKLILEIESRFRKGQTIQQITAELMAKKYDKVEIEEDILRAQLVDTHFIKDTIRSWNIYTYIHNFLLIATILLGIFYTPIFFIATAFIIFEMGIAFLNKLDKDRFYSTSITVTPFIGLTVTQGFFGYNSTLGNYWRWWKLEPGILLSIFFLVFGIYFFYIYGSTFLMWSWMLGYIALLSYIVKPKDNY
jgi:hypothetical protein